MCIQTPTQTGMEYYTLEDLEMTRSMTRSRHVVSKECMKELKVEDAYLDALIVYKKASLRLEKHQRSDLKGIRPNDVKESHYSAKREYERNPNEVTLKDLNEAEALSRRYRSYRIQRDAIIGTMDGIATRCREPRYRECPQLALDTPLRCPKVLTYLKHKVPLKQTKEPLLLRVLDGPQSEILFQDNLSEFSEHHYSKKRVHYKSKTPMSFTEVIILCSLMVLLLMHGVRRRFTKGRHIRVKGVL